MRQPQSEAKATARPLRPRSTAARRRRSLCAAAPLSRALAEHDLVGEYRLVVFPVVLARRRRLLGESPDKLQLDLVDR
jgi:hypothetical protein